MRTGGMRARERYCYHTHAGTQGIYVYYCRTYEKAVSGGGEREKGGHVLRDTTSRGLYVFWTLECSLASRSR